MIILEKLLPVPLGSYGLGHEKVCLQSFRPGLAHLPLCLCAIMKNNYRVRFQILKIDQLICTSIFSDAKKGFSHEAIHTVLLGF